MNSWSKLYGLADRIKALKPWRFMYEDDNTGVRDPVTGTIGFISVMGSLGEHYSVSVYLGERAFGQYLELSENHENPVPETVLEIPQLMLSFEDREFVEKEDRAIMRDLRLTYSGKKSWPVFRSYRPGMVPWILEEKEQESMVNFLEQFLEIAVRPESGIELHEYSSEKLDHFPVREVKNAGDFVKWQDTFQKILIPGEAEFNIPIDPGLMNKVRKIPIGKNIYEIDFFLTPAQVREKGHRPFFPYIFLVIDQKSELIITHEILNPTEGIDKMLCQIPGILLKIFTKETSLPAAVHTTSHRVASILSPLMQNLSINFQLKPRLRTLETVKNSFMDFFSRR